MTAEPSSVSSLRAGSDRLASMKKLTVALGISALVFAIADVLHGQHNGDSRRFYIHVAEFVCFFGFLSLLEVLAFSLLRQKMGLGRWLAGICISLASLLAGFTLFALSGGSMHGDGGPLALSFGLICCIGAIALPITMVGLLASVIMRKLNGPSAP